MTDPRVTKRYKELGEARLRRPAPADVPANLHEGMEMGPGPLWAHDANDGAYHSGGNEGDWDPAYHPDDPEVGPDPD